MTMVSLNELARTRTKYTFGKRYDSTTATDKNVANTVHWTIISNIRKVITCTNEIRIDDNSKFVWVGRRLQGVFENQIEKYKQANYVVTISESKNIYANMIMVLDKQECIDGNIKSIYVADGCETTKQARAKALEYIASQSVIVENVVAKVPKAKSKAK